MMINKLAAQAYENMMLSTEMTKHALSDTGTFLAASGVGGAVGGGLGAAVLGRLGPPATAHEDEVWRKTNKALSKGHEMPNISELIDKLYRRAQRNKILKRGLLGLGAGAALGLGAGRLINARGSRDEMTKHALSDTEALLAFSSGVGGAAGGLGGAVLGNLGPVPSDRADMTDLIERAFRRSGDFDVFNSYDEFLEGARDVKEGLHRVGRKDKILKRGLLGLGGGAALGLGIGHLINVL